MKSRVERSQFARMTLCRYKQLIELLAGLLMFGNVVRRDDDPVHRRIMQPVGCHR